MADINLRSLALVGAKARLNEVREEMASIFNVFPDLRRAPTAQSQLEEGGRGRYGRSVAQRRAASERMRAYWAKRRSETSATNITRSSRQKTRTISPEGRKRIAEAQRKRWAAIKKARRTGKVPR